MVNLKQVSEKLIKGEVATIFTYGILDNLDFILGVPYQWKNMKVDEVGIDNPLLKGGGIGDISCELKLRFYETIGFSFELKPAITLSTGEEEKVLGNGRPSYSLTFISTKDFDPWAFYLNLGYNHKEYKLQEDKESKRKGIWHVSLASELEVAKNLRVVANIVAERNDKKGKSTHPAFIFCGLIYSISENFDIDFGIKVGLTKPETDFTFLFGNATRF